MLENAYDTKVIRTNPAWELYFTIEDDVLSARESLIAELDRISPNAGIITRDIFRERSAKAEVPLMGELFPWIIHDITQGDEILTNRVTKGWLALYAFTLMLDEHLDKNIQISPEKFLAGSLLAKSAIINLLEIVRGTEYEKPFHKSLDSSIYAEVLDVAERSKIRDDKVIDTISKRKNHILIACACALAAVHAKYADEIIEFGNSIILGIQYLDDIADWKDDLSERNLTLLLASLARKLGFEDEELFELEPDNLFGRLIGTGTLRIVLARSKDLLGSSYQIISPLIESRKDSYTRIFFVKLDQEIASLITLLEHAEQEMWEMSPTERSRSIREIQTRIKIVAQQT